MNLDPWDGLQQHCFCLERSPVLYSDTPIDPIGSVNIFAIGSQSVEFGTVKLTLTGPIDLSSPDSHCWARLDLSTEEEVYRSFSAKFQRDDHRNPFGFNGKLPLDFPLNNGEYLVYSPSRNYR